MMISALQYFTVQFLMGRHMLSCSPFHVHIVHVLSSTKEMGPVHLLHLLRQQHCAMFYVAGQSPCCCRVAPPADSVATARCIFCAAKADLKDVSWFAARVCLPLSSHLRMSAGPKAGPASRLLTAPRFHFMLQGCTHGSSVPDGSFHTSIS